MLHRIPLPRLLSLFDHHPGKIHSHITCGEVILIIRNPASRTTPSVRSYKCESGPRRYQSTIATAKLFIRGSGQAAKLVMRSIIPEPGGECHGEHAGLSASRAEHCVPCTELRITVSMRSTLMCRAKPVWLRQCRRLDVQLRDQPELPQDVPLWRVQRLLRCRVRSVANGHCVD